MENRTGHPSPRVSTVLSLLLLGTMGLCACSGPGDSGRSNPLATSLSSVEMKQAVQSALTRDQVLERAELLIPLLQGLHADNVQGAAEAFEEQLSIGSKQELRLFLAAWGKFDPKATLEYASNWTMGNLRSFGVTTVASDWAARGGGQEAAEALLELREWRVRDNALGEMVFDWVSSGDVEGVTEFTAALPESGGKNVLAENIVTSLIQKEGVDGTIAWSNNIIRERDESLWQAPLKKALEVISKRDPERASLWWTQHADQEWAQNGFRTIAFDWAATDPVAALAWIRQLPGDDPRHVALIKIASSWANTDLPGMAEWLESTRLPESEREHLIPPFVRRAAKADPELASQWVDQLKDEREIGLTTVMLVRSWRKKDHRSAVAWLDSREVSEEVRLHALGLKTGMPLSLTRPGTGKPERRRPSDP